MKNKEHYEGTKNWKNYYWYYYKWHIFFILFFAAAIVVCATQCATKVDADCYAVCYCDTYIDDKTLEKYADVLEKYVVDADNDENKRVTFVNCTYPKNDNTTHSNANQLAMLQLQSSDTCIWILDEQGKDMYLNAENIDIFAKYDKFDCDDGYSLALEDCKELKQLNEYSEEKLYIFARKSSDGTISEQAKSIVDGIYADLHKK